MWLIHKRGFPSNMLPTTTKAAMQLEYCCIVFVREHLFAASLSNSKRSNDKINEANMPFYSVCMVYYVHL